MKGLNEIDAEQLLCQHAFLQAHPKEGFEVLVQEYLIECKGLPLSLVKHGKEVFKKTSVSDADWATRLPLQYKNILLQKGFLSEEEIYNVLRKSIEIEEGNQVMGFCMSYPIPSILVRFSLC